MAMEQVSEVGRGLVMKGLMKAWIRVSAAEKESDGWSWAMFLRWKNAVLVIWLM